MGKTFSKSEQGLVDTINRAVTVEALKRLGVQFSADNLTIIKVPPDVIGVFVIPNSVTGIADEAFQGCTGLIEVFIGNSITWIGPLAFQGCTELTKVVIGNSVTTIGYRAFYGCTDLTEVHIGNNVTVIGNWAFAACIGLTELVISNSVTTIGFAAFLDCAGLTEVVIPNSVIEICDRTFQGCTGLTKVVIPNSVTTIGNWAFAACAGLTELVISNSVTTIGDQTFEDCDNLNLICIDTDDDAELARITALLPENLRDKVVSRARYDEIQRQKDEIITQALSIVNRNPKTHSLYHLANNPKNPICSNDILKRLNEFCPDNRYYREAKTEIEALAYPLTDEGQADYIKRCKDIATEYSNLAGSHMHPPESQAFKKQVDIVKRKRRLRL